MGNIFPIGVNGMYSILMENILLNMDSEGRKKIKALRTWCNLSLNFHYSFQQTEVSFTNYLIKEIKVYKLTCLDNYPTQPSRAFNQVTSNI